MTHSDFSFRYFVIGNQSPGNLERVSNGIALSIRTGEYATPRDIADAFRAINPDANFRSDFALAAMPKAKAKLARYTLARLTNHMSKESSRAGGEQIVNRDEKQVTLEHILPQNPGSAWRAAFLDGADPADFINRIGNLTLLKAKVNQDAANTSFSEKLSALNDSTFAINRYFRSVTNWSDKEIDRRQSEMAKVALEVWKL